MPSLIGGDAGNEWTVTFADTMQAPPQPLMAIRNITDPALANVTVPLAKPGQMHRFTDPDAGDALLVVTAPLPVRGFIKRQDFVELSAAGVDPRRRRASQLPTTSGRRSRPTGSCSAGPAA